MKRVIAILLALLMVLGLLTVLFSCDKKEKDGEETKKTDKADKDIDGDDIFAERARVDDGLTTVDYGGREFRVVTHMESEIFIPEEDRNQGDLIKDAKYERNRAVEERFNVKITVPYKGTYQEVSDYVTKTVLSASDEFDLLLGMAVSTGGLVTKNLFLNWYDVENVDFSKPWWAASTSTDLTYDGKCLLAVSDLDYSAISSTYCMVFNKNLAASYDLGDIYGLVLDGDWTFDALTEMVKDVYVDNNGNDKKDEEDFYGMAHGNGSCVNTYLWAFDNPVMGRDEDGVPVLAVKTDKINSIVNSLYDFFYNTQGVYFDGSKTNENATAFDAFLAKKSIFSTASLGTPTGEGLRNFEDEYGLIPYPKWNENQPKYMTMADGYHTVIAVPKTCKDTAFVGMITEALSAESWKTVTPTLYEIALKTRYLRDNESKEVMDLIIDGRTFDFGYIYDNWEGFSFALQWMMADGNTNFESYYSSRYPSAKLHYKTVVKAYDKMS